jgi:hypothetical protein
MNYRILVTGSRDWTDEGAIMDALADVSGELTGVVGGPVTLVHGACPTGADKIAHEVAIRWCWPIEAHPADWSVGKKAGPERNQRMVDLGADVCLAFPLANSRGTRDCMRRAEAAGIPVKVVEG